MQPRLAVLRADINYGFDLEWERCRELLSDLPAVWARFEQQLGAFDGFLCALEQGV